MVVNQAGGASAAVFMRGRLCVDRGDACVCVCVVCVWAMCRCWFEADRCVLAVFPVPSSSYRGCCCIVLSRGIKLSLVISINQVKCLMRVTSAATCDWRGPGFGCSCCMFMCLLPQHSLDSCEARVNQAVVLTRLQAWQQVNRLRPVNFKLLQTWAGNLAR